MHQVFYDETFFIETARNLAASQQHRAEPPGTVHYFHPSPIGWQFLLALIYMASGFSLKLAFYFSSILSSLSIVLLFFLVYLLLESETAALFSALLLACLPIHLRISGSAAHEPAMFFFLIMTLFLGASFVRCGAQEILAASIFSLAWLVHTRPEGGIFIPLFFIYLELLSSGRRFWRQPVFYILAAFLFIFTIPYVLVALYGLSVNFFYSYEPAELIRQHVAENFRGNLLYWFENRIHPFLYTFLAVIGAAALWQRKKMLVLFLIFWFFLAYQFYSRYPSCDFSLLRTLDSWRTALVPGFPLLILGGAGGEAVVGLFSKRFGRRIISALLAFCILLVPIFYAPFICEKHIWMALYEALEAGRSACPRILLVQEDIPKGSLGGFELMVRQILGVQAQWVSPAAFFQPSPPPGGQGNVLYLAFVDGPEDERVLNAIFTSPYYELYELGRTRSAQGNQTFILYVVKPRKFFRGGFGQMPGHGDM
jgi:hypothetical protein